MERLLRQLLSLPSKPAVIYVHAWAGNRPFKFYEGKSSLFGPLEKLGRSRLHHLSGGDLSASGMVRRCSYLALASKERWRA